MKIVHLIVPADEAVERIEIASDTKSQIGGSRLVMPVQAPRWHPQRGPFDDSAPFNEGDTAIYRSSEFYPANMVSVVGDGYFDGPGFPLHTTLQRLCRTVVARVILVVDLPDERKISDDRSPMNTHHVQMQTNKTG